MYSKHGEEKEKRRNTLPYGAVRVCLRSTRVVQQIYGAIREYGRMSIGSCASVSLVQQLVQQIYGAIREYGGFERPEWLG